MLWYVSPVGSHPVIWINQLGCEIGNISTSRRIITVYGAIIRLHRCTTAAFWKDTRISSERHLRYIVGGQKRINNNNQSVGAVRQRKLTFFGNIDWRRMRATIIEVHHFFF